ncbi:DNA polymerase alpha catalytic subunit-like isoform X2 [Armigeres subalbatus]|uniref:DNA polymerase alpha catalytic subunit-like isoform X2 n=1 Tax=Armigeres subalbatus TaxID=124917 RepID=UPI002ED080AF
MLIYLFSYLCFVKRAQNFCAKTLLVKDTYINRFLLVGLVSMNGNIDPDLICHRLMAMQIPQDNYFTMRISYKFNVLPLALQITQIAGNLMNRTLPRCWTEKNEFFLHAFTEKDYIAPDKALRAGTEKPEAAADRSKPENKAAYSGGLVLETIKGFNGKFILQMDYSSLYPISSGPGVPHFIHYGAIADDRCSRW